VRKQHHAGRACKPILAKADVLTVSKALELALFMDAKLDVSKVPAKWEGLSLPLAGGHLLKGVFKMTRDQALEACVRAMLRRKKYSEDMWQDSPDQKNIADNIITALEVLGLWRPTWSSNAPQRAAPPASGTTTITTCSFVVGPRSGPPLARAAITDESLDFFLVGDRILPHR
jgi:hypothetical protein